MTTENNETEVIEVAAEPVKKEKPPKSKKKRCDLLNKTIYKHNFKSNWKLWLILTSIICLFMSLMIISFDPIQINRMVDMFRGMADEESAAAMDGMSITLVRMLAGMFGMMAVILPMIYVLITANSLVASKVDRGSMAYTLSTPIKRKTVAFTNGAYLVSMVTAMFMIIAVVSLVTVQIAHGSVFGTAHTADAQAIARHLNVKPATVTNNLREHTLDFPGTQEEIDKILEVGAKARNINTEDENSMQIYVQYLELKTSEAPSAGSGSSNNMFEDLPEGTINPNLLQGTMLTFMTEVNKFSTDLSSGLRESADKVNFAGLFTNDAMFASMYLAIVDGMESDEITPLAIANFLAANSAPEDMTARRGEFNESMFTSMLISSLAGHQLRIDDGYTFATGDFMAMILGGLLFALAVASIAFFASCFFNLSKHSVAFGTGIPVGFYLLQTLSGIDDSLSGLKYLSMNTLFDPSAIAGGGSYWIQFLVLGAIAVTLFTLSIFKFKKKDLPL